MQKSLRSFQRLDRDEDEALRWRRGGDRNEVNEGMLETDIGKKNE